MSKQISKQNRPDKILVVDDKEQMREVLRKFLAAEKYVVETAENAVEALKKFDETRFDVVLSDIKMPGMDGTELLDEILKNDAQTIVILMTAFGSIEAAVAAIKRGAADYVSKPFQMDDVLFRISRVLKERNLERRVADLENEIQQQTAIQKIVGGSQAIRRLKQIIERLAPLEDTVLITDETGTGKELVARALHETSRRNTKSFVALDRCQFPFIKKSQCPFSAGICARTAVFRQYSGKRRRPAWFWRTSRSRLKSSRVSRTFCFAIPARQSAGRSSRTADCQLDARHAQSDFAAARCSDSIFGSVSERRGSRIRPLRLHSGISITNALFHAHRQILSRRRSSRLLRRPALFDI